VVELLSPRAVQKDIEVASLVDERLPNEVIGDVTRLRQVLLNLAGNAVKFTEKGGVSIVAEPGLWPDEINFEVRDTGIGIPPQAQELIFEEFEQVDGGATRKFGGTGLGLAISKRIIERMGGRIRVDSTPDIGSTFIFTVALPPAERAAVATSVPPDLANAAVLIAAAGQTEPQLIARRLAAWGAQTCIVSDATVACALLPERHWDTLMVDRALGAEATRAIMQACPRATVRRLVLVTPNDRDELASLRDAGFDGYLVKPVRGASLAARFDAANAAFDRSDDAIAERETRLLRSASQSRAGLSILVAEDNDINALLARALLTKLGHRPTVATTGTNAIESWLAARAAGDPYDLVLMDVHMPDIDGLEATRRIRATEAAQEYAKRTPIVALTANAFTEDRSACLDAGMDAFLTKPLDRDRLAEALSALIKPSGAPLAA
jgi:CheY-like chemotaxis protein